MRGDELVCCRLILSVPPRPCKDQVPPRQTASDTFGSLANILSGFRRPAGQVVVFMAEPPEILVEVAAAPKVTRRDRCDVSAVSGQAIWLAVQQGPVCQTLARSMEVATLDVVGGRRHALNM